MTRSKMLQWLAALVMVLSITLLPAAPIAAQAPDLGLLAKGGLVSATEDSVTFEIVVPWEQLLLEPVNEDGQAYVRLSLPDWQMTGQPGAPALPFRTEALGVPFGVDVSVQVAPGPAHTIALSAAALPVVTHQVDLELPGSAGGLAAWPRPRSEVQQDAAIYAGDAAYPGMLAAVAGDGVARQQRVAGIAIYPVQYLPATHEITVYESLTVQVTFGSNAGGRQPSAARPATPEGPAFERLLEGGLLNYGAARGLRQRIAPPTRAPKDTAGDDQSSLQVEVPADEPALQTLAATETGALPWTPPAPGWRIKVRETGLYRLTYAELLAAGVPVNTAIATSSFQLFGAGREVAMQVIDVDSDGSFESADALVFYGQAVNSKYTAEAVYWLTYGQSAGLRMGTRDGTPGSASTPAYYSAQMSMEGNRWYVPNAPGDDDLERWMWDYIYAPSRPSWAHTFTLAAPYAGDYPAARLIVSLLGYLQNAINPDHHARILLNGTQVADVWWDGLAWQTVYVSIPQGLLRAGDNVLTVICPNDTGVGYDVVYIDRVELAFADTFRAEGDVLAFAYDSPGAWKYQVGGFTTDKLAVYDVSDPASVVQIANIVADKAAGTVRFEDTVAVGDAASYVATAITAYRAVRAIEADTASSLHATTNGADHIVITHAAFADHAAALSAFRASQGQRAMAVDVQDIYDEFGYGVVSAETIHDFLAYTYSQWSAPAPSVVVLFGDGHYDPKNYLGYGRTSYVPPYLAAVDPWLGETAADNRYVTLVGGDDLPDMMLGRLAVSTSAEASAIVNKIVAYEQSPLDGEWRQQVLAVADNADSAGSFAQISDALLSTYMADPVTAEKVYYGVTHATAAAARTAIQNGINAGKLIVNYIGHAGTNGWADEGLLLAADMPLLQNSGKLPVMLPMACYEGNYTNPRPSDTYYDSLAEVITRADGKGAVASWSPTGEGVASGHDYLNRGFFQAVFQDGLLTLGQATMAGKLRLWATGANLYLLNTYLLFGDPATTLALPDGGSTTDPFADLQVGLTANPTGPVAPGAALAYTISFVNNGPDTATGIVLADAVPAQLVAVGVSASAGVIQRESTYTWDIAALDPGVSGWVTVSGTVDSNLLPPATIINSAEIMAAEGDLNLANNAATVTTDVVAPPATITMHVADLDGYKSSEVRKTWWASVTALILDNTDAPVANATVAFAWSDGVTGATSCITAADGTCTSISPKMATSVPSVAVQVSNVTHSTATYDAGANLVSSTVVYRDAPVNQAPAAAFTVACTDLACSFDGSGSSDPEGSVLSFGWTFGDGATAAGEAVVSHTYATAGSYAVVLTVTDSQGASGGAAQTVTVGAVSATSMHVAAITMTGGKAGPARFATAVVTIRDDQGNPVAGATVRAQWSRDYTASVEGVTGVDGTVTFTSGKVKKVNATFTFAVTSVVKEGLSYASGQNAVTSATIVVP